MNKEMKNNKVTAEVSILGESLTIVGESSLEYIKTVAKFVNDKLILLNHTFPRMSRNKIIGLGAMNLADELIKTKSEVERLQGELEQLKKENEEKQARLERAEKLAQHYQNEYEELALLLEEECS